MTKLAPRGPRVAATSLALSVACIAALAFPAVGWAEEGGEGEPGSPLTLTPAGLSFPKVTAGAVSSPPEAIDVYNAGTESVAIDTISLEGTDPADFLITGHSCGPLSPGQHCSVWVAFTPASVGAKEATLTVKPKEAPDQTAALPGGAVPPQLSFSPSAYDFGIQPLHDGPTAVFQLTNSGEAAAQLGSIGTSGPNRDNFWVNGGSCGGGYWLQPGESCYVQVQFSPWDMVAYSAQLEVHLQGEAFTADLAGTGGRAILG